MKVTVIMEKATDGYYSCYVEDELDGFGLMGHGATAEAVSYTHLTLPTKLEV